MSNLFNHQKSSNFLSRDDLNAMLFKFKKYYNDLKKANSIKENNINILKENSKSCDKRISELESLKDIEFEKENIGIGGAINESKEQIQEKIEKMIFEKKNLDQKY